MNGYKEYLEQQIRLCDDLPGMEREKWAFIQCLKKYRKCHKADIKPPVNKPE